MDGLWEEERGGDRGRHGSHGQEIIHSKDLAALRLDGLMEETNYMIPVVSGGHIRSSSKQKQDDEVFRG